ncbi:ABC transporter substrate-binding protein [Frankia sp. Cr1]|uniref:ABC transporter substrate-binding protein n=1 Tax=Frankia sp. Cr1 TaxID=3073931 RepID=UPI002AD45C5A|nr:ABC transporter substrate-binding protein [Frankia sp. Cr1]
MTQRTLRGRAAMVSVTVAAALTVAACGSSGGSGGGSTGPIKVGAVASLTGPLPFPDATAGAKAAFDEINANGGINGRKIEYIVRDDASDPATAAQVGRQLVEQEHVVANVASLSAAGDCTTNVPMYQRNKVYTIGLGLQPQCTTASTFAPVNAGPVISGALQDIYVKQELGISEQCYFGTTGPGLAATDAAIRGIAEKYGVTFKYFADSQGPNDPPTPFVVNAKQAGCKSLAYGGIEPQIVSTLQAVQAQGFPGKVIAPTTGYSESLITAAGKTAEGLYAASEFVPITSNDPAVVAYRNAVQKAGGKVTALSEGGYIAAQLFASVLKSISDDITPASVAAALEKKTPLSNPLLLSPWTFGHFPNRSIQMVQVQGGKWVPVGKPQTLPETALAK